MAEVSMLAVMERRAVLAQVLAAASALIALGLLIWQAFRPHDPAKMFVNKVAAKKAAAEAEAITEETSEE